MSAKTIFDVPKGTPYSSSVTTPFWARHTSHEGAYFGQSTPVQTGSPAPTSDGYFAQFNPTL